MRVYFASATEDKTDSKQPATTTATVAAGKEVYSALQKFTDCALASQTILPAQSDTVNLTQQLNMHNICFLQPFLLTCFNQTDSLYCLNQMQGEAIQETKVAV